MKSVLFGIVPFCNIWVVLKFPIPLLFLRLFDPSSLVSKYLKRENMPIKHKSPLKEILIVKLHINYYLN